MLLWCLIMTTFAGFRYREISELFDSGGFDAQVKFQAATWVALGVLGLYLLASGRADLRLLRRGPLFWYACFVLTALLSTLYSPQPAFTAYRAVQHAVAIVLIISLRKHFESVYLFIAAFLAVNWVLVVLGSLGITGGMEWIFNPADKASLEAGIEGAWRFESAFGHPSQISIVAAAGAAGLAYRMRGRNWMPIAAVIGWFALTTLLTVSRTAIVGLLGGLAVAALGRRALLPCVCLAGFVLPLLMMSSDFREASSHYLARGQARAELRSLTGRIPAYREAMRRIEQYWPLGRGFQAGRVEALDETGENMAVGHAHNLLLESLFSMGLLGGVFSLLVLVSLAIAVGKILQRDAAVSGYRFSVGWELAAMLVPLYAFCVLDSGFVANLNPVAMLFLVVIATAQTAVLGEKGKVPHRQEATGDEPCPR